MRGLGLFSIAMMVGAGAAHAAPTQSRMAVTVEQFVSTVEAQINKMRVVAPVPALECKAMAGGRACISNDQHLIRVTADDRENRIMNFGVTLDLTDGVPETRVFQTFLNICKATLMSVDTRISAARAETAILEMSRRATNATRGSQLGTDRRNLPGDVAFFVSAVPGGSTSCHLIQDED